MKSCIERPKLDDLRAMRLLVPDYSEQPDLADAIARYYALLQMTFATNIYKVYETTGSQIFKFLVPQAAPAPAPVPEPRRIVASLPAAVPPQRLDSEEPGGGRVWAWLLLALVIFPGLYYLSIRLAKWYAGADAVPTKELFIKYAYMLVPMGLLAWIAFSVPLLMVNGSYIISVVSDPLGWGMNLFGTAEFPWKPLWPQWVPFIQVPILLTGLYYGLRGVHKVGSQIFSDPAQLRRSLIAPGALLLGVTLVFLKLFIG